jgi:hypothetical protein
VNRLSNPWVARTALEVFLRDCQKPYATSPDHHQSKNNLLNKILKIID